MLGCATLTPADQIKLKNGLHYDDVTIVSRDDSNLHVQVKHGIIIAVPLSTVQSTNGVELWASTEGFSPAPDFTPPTLHEEPIVEPPPPPYVHTWKMERFLGCAAVLVIAWIWVLLWVQRDARGSLAEIKRANTDVLLLPFLGFIIYLIKRYHRLRQKVEEPHTLTGRVAGLRPTEAPKKRGLFGDRTKILAPFHRKKQRLNLEFLDANRNTIEVKKNLPEMTGIEAAREVLEDAISERASDVHVEPQEAGCRVRFRIDGVLQERMAFEKTDGLRVAAALKALAQIDVAEKRKAQDGRFRVRTKDGEVDFRVATASSIHGEKLVLRILDRKSGLLGLGELGMPKLMLQEFDRVIHSRNGVILATGPTGSGKTSTLYAALSRLDAKRLNLMTIEDPVEYELEGATQIPVNPKAGVTYESGLRSILRQDPDVIFVGEMRDAEAAKITIRAALTGHLVFSSLHTKDAPSTLLRLEEMGVEKYQTSSALLLIVAQRLVRVLCKKCREAYNTTGSELSELGIALPEGRTIYRESKCDACDNSGFQGRTGIFELLVLDEELRRVVNEGVSQQQLVEIASKKSYRSYREDGVDKILRGLTTVEEVLQAR
jgi:general secretion pathway protein E